ncbi:MAG: T9SS type A sorting domain-containing protein [Lewinellaceae bacterium]|nr:T9SS type A sorting domain-containing protein [Lewinellaceae bacterium]
MKRFFFFWGIFSLGISTYAQPCLSEDIYFNTQEQIDNFPLIYTDCNSIDGNVFIGGPNIFNLDGLAQINSIGGALYITDNNSLTDIYGLNSLTFVGGWLNISNNPNLSDCDVQGICNILSASGNLNAIFIFNNGEGCSSPAQIQTACGIPVTCPGNLYINSQSEIDDFPQTYPGCTSISGVLSIDGEDIENLNGLAQITQIGSILSIHSYNLPNLLGLDALVSVGESFYLSGNFTSLLGLEALSYIGYTFQIEGCPNLTSLEGLNNLSTINFEFHLQNNGSLASLEGLNSLTQIGGSFFLEGSLVPNFTGLEALSYIGGNVYIDLNSNLINFTGLNNLSSIGGIAVYGNPQLENFIGLESLTSVFWAFEINNNNSLSTLEGLDNLAHIFNLTISSNNSLTSLVGLNPLNTIEQFLTIENNPLLSFCEIQPVCDHLAIPGSYADISNNGIGCSSRSEVEYACNECPGPDNDCDGVADICDVCPGGDDSIDNNKDGLPDCQFPPPYSQIIPAWKCQSNKVWVCHNGSSICVNQNSLPAHIAHGDYLGPCDNVSCNSGFAIKEEDGNKVANWEKQGVFKFPKASKFTIHPNPATSKVWLDLTDYEGIFCLIRISDLRGKIVYSTTLQNDWRSPFQLNLKNLPSGMYFVQIQPEGEEGMVVKLVVQKN